MLPCWHHINKVWHSFIPGMRVSLCKECSTTYLSDEEWITSACLASVDPKAMRVCDRCFREYCVEVISY
jgi:hypothetical protein